MSEELRRYYLQTIGIDLWLQHPKKVFKLMIIAESPDFYNELLTQMLFSIGLKKEEVYMANIKQGSDFLKQQIELINPNLVLALGQVAGQFLIGQPSSLSEIRNKIHQVNEKPFMVSYHPADLLRNPKDKKQAYADLLVVRKLLNS